MNVSWHPSARGFTLLELLAAMALLALLMLGVWSGIRTAAQTTSRGRAQVDRMDQIRGAEQFLRRNLAQTTPIPWARDDDGQSIVFRGGPRDIRFVAPLPGFLGRLGPQWQRLQLVPDGDDGGLRLQITFARLSPDGSELQPMDKPEVLLTGIREGVFNYRGRDLKREDTGWQVQWPRGTHVPDLVRIKLKLDDGRWPTLTVPLRVDTSAVNRSGLRLKPGSGVVP